MREQYKKQAGLINGMPSKSGQMYGGLYVPPYFPPNYKCYERDGLMTYIDELKYLFFAENSDKWQIGVFILKRKRQTLYFLFEELIVRIFF